LRGRTLGTPRTRCRLCRAPAAGSSTAAPITIQATTPTGSFCSSSGPADVAYALLELTVLRTTGPVNTVAPAVTGTTTVGQVLTSTAGTWTDDGSGVKTYQWQRDNTGGGSYSNIGSATSSTYTLVDADDACNIRCVVTDTDGVGATAANSNAVGTVIEP